MKAKDALAILRGEMSVQKHGARQGVFTVQAVKIATEVLEEAERNEGWIPIKYRPMTEEEKEAFFDTYGTEADPAEIFDCPMPEDEEEILLTIQNGGRSYTDHDTCLIDCNLYWLEDRGDWENVTAWRPVPKPYGGDDETGRN